jgi:peptidoglycan/LPS O-acetylase OafA/YrhL
MFGLYRFILAINVVLFHILSVPEIGPFAVYSFFVLSGFLMTHIMQRTYGYTANGMIRYAINRFFRLYPVYWALLIITLMMNLWIGNDFFISFHPSMQLPQTVSEIFANIFMIFPELSPRAYSPRLAPATWALTIELFFYLLIALGISRNKLLSTLWFSLSALYFLYENIVLKIYGFGYGTFIAASLPFSLGAVLYFYIKEISYFLDRLKLFTLPVCTILFAINLIICIIINLVNIDELWKYNLLCSGINLILSALMVIRLSVVRTQDPILKYIDRITGDLSYPVYLFHWAATCFAAWLVYEAPVKNTITFTLGLIITILISIVINKLVNEKIEVIRNKLKKGLKSNKMLKN